MRRTTTKFYLFWTLSMKVMGTILTTKSRRKTISGHLEQQHLINLWWRNVQPTSSRFQPPIFLLIYQTPMPSGNSLKAINQMHLMMTDLYYILILSNHLPVLAKINYSSDWENSTVESNPVGATWNQILCSAHHLQLSVKNVPSLPFF